MKINLKEKFSEIHDYWDPKIVASLNGQEVRMAKIKGTFVWHHHENEDELFWVHKGKLVLEFKDHKVTLLPGEMMVVPRGVPHRPVAQSEVELLLFEPAGTINTGDQRNEFTKTSYEEI